MKIAHDLIAAVSGPEWKYGLSRILIDDEGNGIVFVAGAEEPLTEFTVTTFATSKGTGSSVDGDITWRRRGTSCQYKLAKCKVSTEQMKARWEAYLGDKGETQTEEPTLSVASADPVEAQQAEEPTVADEEPASRPSTDWKADELRAYAEKNGIDLDGATRKADMVAAIESAEDVL